MKTKEMICEYCDENHLGVSVFCKKYPSYKELAQKYKWAKSNIPGGTSAKTSSDK